MNIQELIQKHGKQLISELVDRMIICNKLDDEEIRLLLIKHKVITRATKRLLIFKNYGEKYERLQDGKYGYNKDKTRAIVIKNRSGKIIISINFNDSELQSILEMLK